MAFWCHMNVLGGIGCGRDLCRFLRLSIHSPVALVPVVLELWGMGGDVTRSCSCGRDKIMALVVTVLELKNINGHFL